MKKTAMSIIRQHKYPPETAGRIMITNVPVASPRDKIGEVYRKLIQDIGRLETINYIYVVNGRRELVGVISIKDILRRPKDMVVSQVMSKKMVYTHPHTDQERVVYQALEHNIKSVPVLDKNKIFLGVVPSDVILSVMHREASEDIMHMAGVQHRPYVAENVMEVPILTSLKRRLPWLLIGLAGGILTARVIGMFRDTLEDNIILASFIPLIVYMGGAVEAQLITFYVRDIAVSSKIQFSRYFLRQFTVAALIAFITSGVLYTIGFAFYRDVHIANVVGVALFAAVISSVFTGLIVPNLFSRFKMDPANASGPIATIMQDLLSVTIYFTIATLLL